jgi:hypothetical protein
MEGGFFLRKKPLECEVSVERRSENAVAALKLVRHWLGLIQD